MTVDAADTGWTGRVGVVPTLISRAGLEPDSTIGMVCGPEVMMRFSVEALADSGVSPDRIYLSLERNMRCAVGHCGHCQWGPDSSAATARFSRGRMPRRGSRSGNCDERGGEAEGRRLEVHVL